MKKLIVSLAACAALLMAAPALADSEIGIVNITKIMKDSKAAVSLRSQVDSKRKALQTEYQEKSKSLHAEDKALVGQQKTADKAAFDKKVADFRARADKEAAAIEAKRKALDTSFTNALEEIQKNVADIVKQISAEKKLNVVFSAAQVIYNEPSLDITDEVLKRLDSKLPSVTSKF